MSDGGTRQRLTAILAADAVGYSRLMEEDERATASALDAAKEIFKTHIAANQGHVVNMAGDSVLAVFETASGAINAALAVQRALNATPLGTVDGHLLHFRIGVHLGDVIEKSDGDVYGDGVNIAARLQALAEPGGIVVSEAVRGAVKNRVAAAFEDRGAQNVKNISDPVHAFTVRLDGQRASPATATPKYLRRAPGNLLLFGAAGFALLIAIPVALWLLRPSTSPVAAPPAARSVPANPSIAVLPFDNMSGDPEQTYFADGITEDLITDLSKVSGLFVIARNSTFVYKGRSHDIREIGKTLGVRYVLEGSVRKSGNDIRVNAQLIDAVSGGHLWADRYDGELKNIFGLQDTVTRNVVKALAIELTKDDSARVTQRGTQNGQAYDVFLKGWERYLRQTPDDFRAAVVDFKKAAELDPNYGRAYAALAATYWETYTRYWGQAVGIGGRPEDVRYAAEEFLAKAMRAPTPLAHQVASALLLQSQQPDEALDEAKRAIESDPNDADGYIALARAQSFSGKPAEALVAVERAMRLNPHYPASYLYQQGLAQFAANNVNEAAASLERAIAMNPDDYWSQRLLLAAYGLLGRRDDAAKLFVAIKSKDQRGENAFRDPLAIRAVTYWYPFAKADDAERFTGGLRKAGVPE